MTTQIDVLKQIVERRRAVRKFNSTPIPDEMVQHALDLALLAPNSSNLQPWEFYVIKTPALKEKAAKACLSQNAATTSQLLIAVVARTNTWRQHSREILEQWPGDVPQIAKDYYSKTALFHYNQGPLGLLGFLKRVLFSAMGIFRPIPRGPFSHADMKLWAGKSCALAANTLMLALQAYHVDSCPMEGFDEKRISVLLKLPKDAFVVMMIGVGQRAEEGVYHPRFRFERERFVRWV